MERSETVEKFRERLSQVIEERGVTRSAFATEIGLDRSTLSQLLSPGNERLPRAETIVSIARVAQVSVDWLLGVIEQGRAGTQLVANALEIEPGAGLPMDERLERWHKEAVGAKVRYVPSTLPDLLKSPAIIRYEYEAYGALVPQARIEQAEARLAYTRRPETDIEVCTSSQSLRDFAEGRGIWDRLDREARVKQLESMAELTEELYPTFRWFLFDGLWRYSAPYTIFGAKRAAVYLGNMYFVFNGGEQIRALTRHFDDLIRGARMQPPDVPNFILGLLRDLPPKPANATSGKTAAKRAKGMAKK